MGFALHEERRISWLAGRLLAFQNRLPTIVAARPRARSLERWDRGFESHPRHTCTSALILFRPVSAYTLQWADHPSKESDQLPVRFIIKKVKLSLCLIDKAPRHEDARGSWGTCPPFSTSAFDWSEWSASRSVRFTPRESGPGTHWIGGWVGPRAGLTKISCPCGESNPGRPSRSLSLYRLFKTHNFRG
jgi:hypothetical protein